jgi:hypothetical protein
MNPDGIFGGGSFFRVFELLAISGFNKRIAPRKKPLDEKFAVDIFRRRLVLSKATDVLSPIPSRLVRGANRKRTVRGWKSQVRDCHV